MLLVCQHIYMSEIAGCVKSGSAQRGRLLFRRSPLQAGTGGRALSHTARAFSTFQVAQRHPARPDLMRCAQPRKDQRVSAPFFVVDPLEAPVEDRRISSDSPLGRALLGRHVGEVVEVDAPGGRYRCRESVLPGSGPTCKRLKIWSSVINGHLPRDTLSSWCCACSTGRVCEAISPAIRGGLASRLRPRGRWVIVPRADTYYRARAGGATLPRSSKGAELPLSSSAIFSSLPPVDGSRGQARASDEEAMAYKGYGPDLFRVCDVVPRIGLPHKSSASSSDVFRLALLECLNTEAIISNE